MSSLNPNQEEIFSIIAQCMILDKSKITPDTPVPAKYHLAIRKQIVSQLNTMIDLSDFKEVTAGTIAALVK